MSAEEGRRARSKRAKLERIRAAAAGLFDDRGFAATTTSEIAERADVAEGTLFRYAASKAELLLMVLNERLRRAVEEGRAATAADDGDPAASIRSLIAPVVAAVTEQPANSRAYQRELLFGDRSDQYRAEGLELIAELEDEVAARLVAAGADPDDAVPAARATVAVLHHAVAEAASTLHPERDPLADLDRQVGMVVAGCLARVPG